MDPLLWVLGLCGVGVAAKASGGASASFGADAAHGVLTPGRKDLYERAMRAKGRPDQYAKLADEFDRSGLPVHARTLRARGEGRKASPAIMQARREAVRRAFQSRDPMKVEQFAEIAERDLGMTITAERLREYAKGLRDANVVRHSSEMGADYSLSPTGAPAFITPPLPLEGGLPHAIDPAYPNAPIPNGAPLNPDGSYHVHTAECQLGTCAAMPQAPLYAEVPGMGDPSLVQGPMGPPYVTVDPYVAEPCTVAITGDGGTLASSTQMAGERVAGCNGMGADCLVHSTGGGCSVGRSEVEVPPPAADQREDGGFFNR